MKLDVCVPLWYNGGMEKTSNNPVATIKTSSYALWYELEQDFVERGLDEYADDLSTFSEAWITLAYKIKGGRRGQVEVTIPEARELAKSLENIILLQEDWLEEPKVRGIWRAARTMLAKTRAVSE